MSFRKAYLEITNVCNLRCSFCPGHSRKAAFLSPADFRFLAGQIRPYTEYLYLHVMGEPLLHPQLQEILSICEAYSFRVILTTNGTLLPEKQKLLLSAPALYKVNLSLHSFEGNAGQEGSLRQYILDCCDFADAASRQGILCILRLWNENAPGLPGKNTHNGEILELLRQRLPGEWQPNSKGLRIRHRLHLEWDEVFSWPDLSLPTVPPHGCYALRDQFAVLCDGTVVPCCLDRDGRLSLGNLFETPLPQLLASPAARALQEGLAAHIPSAPLCLHCGYAAAKFP